MLTAYNTIVLMGGIEHTFILNQYLATMLLNEMQKQYRRAEAEAKVITKQEGKIEVQQQRIKSLQIQVQQKAELQQRIGRLEPLMETAMKTSLTSPSPTSAQTSGGSQ